MLISHFAAVSTSSIVLIVDRWEICAIIKYISLNGLIATDIEKELDSMLGTLLHQIQKSSTDL